MQTVVKAGTNFAQIGPDYFPLNSLILLTRQDKLVMLRTVQGLIITPYKIFSEYSDASNVPYESFDDLVADLQSAIFPA